MDKNQLYFNLQDKLTKNIFKYYVGSFYFNRWKRYASIGYCIKKQGLQGHRQ